MGLFDGLIASLPDAKGSTPSAKSSSTGGGEIESLLRNKAAEYDIDPDLFVSLAKRESGLRPDAKNPGSTAGGLFQFIDGTWNRYGNKKDKFDPEANADAAARMLRDNLGMFEGDYSKALAAHHVGAGKAATALTDRRVGDKDVSTQQWLSDIFTGAGRDNPMAKPRGAFSDAEAGIGGYDQIRRGQIAQAASDESPVSTSLKRGMKGLTNSAGLAVDNMLGDSESAAQRIIDKQAFDQATPAPSSVQKFGRDWDALAEDDYTGMFGTILKNPAGSFNMMLEQTPNSLPGMAFQTVAGVAGRGLMALGPVGAAAGLGLQGLSAFAGNFLPEGGAFIEEQLHKSGVDTNDVRAVAKWIEEHRGENFKGGATKAGVISAVDGVTGWMGMKMLAGPSVRFAKAEKDFFAKNGVNVADSAALQTARASDAYKTALQPFAADLVKASEGFGMLKRGVGATALDAMGEGVGEYAGSYAATGDASIKDAVIEGVMGVGQGAAMAGAQYGIGKMSGPDLVMEELRKLATANIAPAEAKPNSPLSNAAQAAQAADPITEALKPISERFADRALYEQIRNHPNLGPDAMTQILSAYRVATNSNMDPMARQAAVDRLGEFFRLFDNQPNFTAGKADAPGVPAVVGNPSGAVGPADPRVGAIDGEASRVTPNQQQGAIDQSYPALATDERARKAAEAEYEAAYQDLVKAEQLGASDQELMQRQIAMRNAEARLQEINDAIESNRAKETAEKRGGLLDRVLASNPENPNRAFDRALRLEGFRDSTFTEEEKSKIARFNELRSIQEDGVFSAPNEAGAFGIREKRASAPAGRYQHLADMLSSGWQLANRHQLTGPNGEVYNLKGAGEAQFVRNKLNQKDGNGNQSPRGGAQGGTDQGDFGVGGAGANGPLPQGGGNGSGQANALPDTRPADGAVSEAEATGVGSQPNNSLARSRLTALEDPRIAKYADDLRSMAPDAGLAEEGGRLLIAPDGTKSRTKWIPRAEWFVAGMLNSPQESVDAVEKAISGQPMRKPEKLHVQGMMDFLDMQYGIDGESHTEQLATLSDIAYEGESADAQNIIDTLGDVDLESNGAWADEVESMRALGFTEEEINEITRRKQGAFGSVGEEAAGVSSGETQGAIPEGDGNGNGQAEGQEGFSLNQQTNEEAAAQFAQQQAGEPTEITKEQADKERGAVPFSMQMQSQTKPQGTQVGLFTADGRPGVAAKQPESVKRKIFRDNKETGIREVHEVDAQDVAISGLPDHQFFVFKDEEKGAYSLTEASTGLRVGIGETAEAAIANFKAALEKVGVETFAQRVADSQKITVSDETKPDDTQPVAQRSFVRTYKTKSGKIGARIEKVVGPTGKVFYNYTGEWGAGSGHALAQMDKIESMWRKEKRGYTVVEAEAAAKPAFNGAVLEQDAIESMRKFIDAAGAEKVAAQIASVPSMVVPEQKQETKQSNSEFTHNGVRIYPIAVNVGGEQKQMWGVESSENKAKREAGQRYGFGDSLLDTKEQAIAAADRQISDDEATAKYEDAKKSKEAEDAKRRAEIEADTYNGFLDGQTPAKKGLIRKALAKQWRFDGVAMTSRERIESLLAKGELEVDSYEEDKIKPMSRTQFNRASQREQDAHEKKVREGGKVTVYTVSGSDLGKIAHDYASFLLSQQKADTSQEPKAIDTKPESDWLGELFGSDSSQMQPVEQNKNKKVDLSGLVGKLREFSDKKLAEANDWASRQYKQNKTKVSFEGDGPTRNESMSISAANESRRNRNVDSLQHQAQMASNLANRIERGFDVQEEIEQAIRNAESDIKRDGKARFGGTRESQIEAYISNSMLGDASYGFGEGTLPSLIRKAYEQSQQKTDTAPKASEQAAPVSQPENDKPAYADDAELQDALSHLGDVLGDVFGAKLNITGKQYGASDLLPAMSKVIELLIKKGFKSFRESVGAATNAMRGNANTKGFVDQITPRQWKAAYNSVAEFHEGTDSEEDVAKYSAEQIAKIIALPEKIKEAEQATNHDATPGQKEAGNYAKGKFAWHGLNIAVETAKGEDRTDKETNGEKWRVTMPATYGYILGTVGADKDNVDVFMGDKPESQRVYVVNQTKPGSTEFDEHKIMLGYESEGAAIGDYLLSFSDTFGASVLGSVSGPYAIDDFKHMLESNRFSRAKPISDRLSYVNPRVKEKPVEQQPPGVKTNGTKEKAAAERLAQLLDKMDQVRIDRNTPEGSAKGIVRSVIDELRKERTAVSVSELLETASQRLVRQHAPFSEVIDQVVESLRSDASPDNKGDIKQAGVSLDKFGLTVRRSQTKNGTPTWEVSGNTRDHVAALRNAGGKWYGPKKVWSFYSEESPEGKILAALGASPDASEIALSDIEVERKSDGPGRIKTYTQRADEALSEIDEKMSLGKQLLECLNS